MAIKIVDRNRAHEITLDKDQDPQTVFHVRVLTQSQRAQAAGKAISIERTFRDQTEVYGNELEIGTALALDLWEMLVIDVTQVSAPVEKKQGPFGFCVPKEWPDNNLDIAQIIEIVMKGFASNVLTEPEKKTSGEQRILPDTLTASSVTNADKPEKTKPEDVPGQDTGSAEIAG